MKRLFDIMFSLSGIVLLSPLFVLLYLAQRIASKGPAIYRQERIGKDGNPFYIYKFRTMETDNESDGIPRLADDDSKLTRIGRQLRRTHLDELPQLWNVLKGDMSFVGYRPERKYFIDQIMADRPDYARLYQIRPGITSAATIYNGYTFTFDKMITRLDMDLEYLERMSLAEDIKILTKTIIYIVFGKKF